MQAINGAELDSVRLCLSWLDPAPAEGWAVSYEPLPFHKSGALLSIGDGGHHAIAAGPGPLAARWLLPLNGYGAPIMEANRRAGLVLTEATAEAYLRFFCRFMYTPEGPFFKLVEPPGGCALERAGDGSGGYVFRVVLLFGGTRFRAGIHVAGDGSVSMPDEPEALHG